jgi:pimeloyl-ACP methyl ester carboxylesterase
MTLAYDRAGRGEPLLLIHGTGSQRQVWEPVRARLEAQRELVMPDLPGFGDSPPLDRAAVTPEDYADVLERLLDELGLGRVHVAGNSLGGGIGLVLGARGRARSVTALSPIGFRTPREDEYARHSLRASAVAARALAPLAPTLTASAVVRTLTFSQLVARPWRIPPAAALGATRNLARSRGLRAALDGHRRWRFVPDAPLPLPVTVAWGERDRLLPVRQAERARRALPDARHVTLVGCGHVPTWDDPEQVAAVLLQGSGAG